MSDDEQEKGLWIITEPTIEGNAFAVVVKVDGRGYALTTDDAFRHARQIFTALAYAEYDAAVLHQMHDRLGEDQTKMLLHDIQQDRAPYEVKATPPFSYLPAVGTDRKTGKTSGVIALEVSGTHWGVMTGEQAREHAIGLIQATSAAELDAAYLRTLRGVVGLDEGRARTVVAELAEHR